MHVKPHHALRAPIWSGISALGVIGPYFFEDVTGNAGGVTGDFIRGTPDRTMCPEGD